MRTWAAKGLECKPACPERVGIGTIPGNQDHWPVRRYSRLHLKAEQNLLAHCLLHFKLKSIPIRVSPFFGNVGTYMPTCMNAYLCLPICRTIFLSASVRACCSLTCVHARMYACMRARTHARTHACMHACKHTYMYTHTRTMYIYIYVCIYTCNMYILILVKSAAWAGIYFICGGCSASRTDVTNTVCITTGYIYMLAPPPKIHLERFQSIRLENSVHLCTREKDRERAREKEGVHNKEERQREQTD